MTPSVVMSQLSELVSAAVTLTPELSFLTSGGVLALNGPWSEVRSIRIDLPPAQFLHLQSIDVDAPGTEQVSTIATVSVSSWYKDFDTRFDARAFFDFESDTRTTAVHTTNAGDEWISIVFDHPIDVRSLRLRNVEGNNCLRARLLRVTIERVDCSEVVFDGAESAAAFEATLTNAVSRRTGAAELMPFVPIVAMTMRGEYRNGRLALDAVEVDADTKKGFRKLMSSELLTQRSMEWTSHGTQRSFRFWSDYEKAAYTRLTARVADTLSELTPNVCFGFGAALAVVRDGDLIPHDDDLDLIVGFEPEEAANLPDALRLIEEFLRSRGFTVKGSFTAHRHVQWQNGKMIDVFAGLFEGDTISWYPGRRGSLDRATMFPTSQAKLHGVTVPLPRSPFVYLEKVYGPGWRWPDPGFTHLWDNKSYLDLVQRPGGTSG